MWNLNKPVVYLIVSILLVIYGTYGILTDNFVIPNLSSRKALHLHGFSAWGLYFGFVSVFLLFLSNFLAEYYANNNIDSFKYSPTKVKRICYFAISLSICLTLLSFITK